MKALKQKIKKLSKSDYLKLRDFSRFSNNLYNYCNYIIKQYYIENSKYIGYNKLYDEVKNNENYKLLPSQCSQQIIKLIDKNYRSFFALLRRKQAGKYLGKINSPKYRKKGDFYNIIYPSQSLRLKNGNITLNSSRLYGSGVIKIKFTHKIEGNIKQIVIIPRHNGNYFDMIINYFEKEKLKVENFNNHLSIDLGVNNFATCFNKETGHSFIMSGTPLKSYNRNFNKTKARIQKELKIKNEKNWSNKLEQLTKKRGDWINNYFNQVVSKITNYCLNNEIGTVIIGESKNWKKEVNLGRVNNQKFVMIPHGTFKQKLENKLAEFGIKTKLVSEDFTSKCSCLDIEEIKKQEEYNGKRIKRGLFKVSNGRLLNADINGAVNLLRKVVGDDFLKVQPVLDLMFNPVKLRIFNKEI